MRRPSRSRARAAGHHLSGGPESVGAEGSPQISDALIAPAPRARHLLRHAGARREARRRRRDGGPSRVRLRRSGARRAATRCSSKLGARLEGVDEPRRSRRDACRKGFAAIGVVVELAARGDGRRRAQDLRRCNSIPRSRTRSTASRSFAASCSTSAAARRSGRRRTSSPSTSSRFARRSARTACCSGCRAASIRRSSPRCCTKRSASSSSACSSTPACCA